MRSSQPSFLQSRIAESTVPSPEPPVDSRTALSDSLGTIYLHQTETGSVTHDPSGARWSFSWQAPTEGGPEGGGPVVIHVAANSGNGDNSPLGDLVYTTERTLPMASTTPTPAPSKPPP